MKKTCANPLLSYTLDQPDAKPFDMAGLIRLVLLLVLLVCSGCLTRRTIKEGDTVVAQGYIIKPPLARLGEP